MHLSGLVGAIEAARSGTTVLFDHHASPSFIRGSLDTLRRATEEVGLRSVLCYETTDRNGLEGRDAGIAENRAFNAGCLTALTRGMVGAHASFTLSDASLDRWPGSSGKAAPACTSTWPRTVPTSRIAGSAAEPASSSACGGTVSSARGRCSSTVSTSPRRELREAQDAGAWLVHCPRSNTNNAVGYAPDGGLPASGLGHGWPRPGHAGRGPRRLPEGEGRRAFRRARRGPGHARRRAPSGRGLLRHPARHAGG